MVEFSWRKVEGASVVTDILALRLGPSLAGCRKPLSLADLTKGENVVVLLWLGVLLALCELDLTVS